MFTGPHKAQYVTRLSATIIEFILFGTGVVQCRILEESTTGVDLDDVSVAGEFSGTTLLDIGGARVLGESPLGRLEDLLAAGKLEFSAADRLHDVRLGRVLGADAEQDLSDIDTGGNPNGLSVRVPHARGQPIGTGARKHLVGAQDVEGMGANADVVGVLSDRLGQVLVDGDTAGLEGLGRDLLLLVADQMGHKGEEIDGGLLVADVEDLDLRFWYTTAVPRLDVRLVLLVSVATSWTATHGGIFIYCMYMSWFGTGIVMVIGIGIVILVERERSSKEREAELIDYGTGTGFSGTSFDRFTFRR